MSPIYEVLKILTQVLWNWKHKNLILKGGTQIWSRDPSICSWMLYHWAVPPIIRFNLIFDGGNPRQTVPECCGHRNYSFPDKILLDSCYWQSWLSKKKKSYFFKMWPTLTNKKFERGFTCFSPPWWTESADSVQFELFQLAKIDVRRRYLVFLPDWSSFLSPAFRSKIQPITLAKLAIELLLKIIHLTSF